MLIRRHNSAERIWQLSAASQPHRDRHGQRQAYELAAAEGQVGQVRVSSFELADDATRVAMVGSALAKGGQAWAQGHPEHLAWLARQGVSADEAQRRNAAAVAQELTHEFWSPARKPKPRNPT